MLNRWIIVGEPRCGSHWLHSKLTPRSGLDEFINYPFYTNANHDFTFDENNFIRCINSVPTEVLTREEFVQKRINQIKRIHPIQPVKGILFCNIHQIDYTEIIKTLDECRFKFIMLERNVFDRALSHCIATITKLAHRWTIQTELPSADSLGKINVDLDVWLDALFREYQATEYRKSLFLNYEFVTVRYENLIEDCRTNNIPIVEEDAIIKTWNIEYKDIVTNITDLQEIYKSFIKHIPMYSQFFLTYAR
jgi:hypothetical protein